MIDKATFLEEFNGHSNAYSSYMVITNDLDALLKALNEIDSSMCVGSGIVSEKSIYFEICKETPDLIYNITERLHCVGYADMDTWYGESFCIAAKDGNDFDGFTAQWQDGMPYKSDEDVDDEESEWDCFVDIFDESGEVFHTGAGVLSYEQRKYWGNFVLTH